MENTNIATEPIVSNESAVAVEVVEVPSSGNSLSMVPFKQHKQGTVIVLEKKKEYQTKNDSCK